MTSIKTRLIQMQLLLSIIVLIACSAGSLFNDFLIFKKSVERNLETTAKILARNLSSTLAFLDKGEATKILSSLEGIPSITSALVYDSNGNLFSTYGEDKTTPTKIDLAQNTMSSHLEGTHLILFHPLLESKGELSGLIILKADLKISALDYKGYIWIVAAVFMTVLLLSFILAHLIQRSISEPITAFAETAKTISQSGNYALRVQNSSSNEKIEEIEALFIEFNRMLDQIQNKDKRIKAANADLERKIEERTTELKEIQKSALENAHAAGMAEVATGVLHNVGNIMNSVNISVEEISQIVQKSKLGGLLKANELLNENLGNISEFFSTDPKGKLLPEYYLKIGETLSSEQAHLKEETESLLKQLTFIKDAIQMQQEYARTKLFFEEMTLDQITDDILKLQQNALIRHDIQLTKIYNDKPNIKVQKVKFAHILLNLIKNAKESMENVSQDRKQLTIEVGRSGEQTAFLKVRDLGEGIPENNLDKIFGHGFTTKTQGHGFGLHFCANAMTEMGGTLSVESEGINKGATFTLTFPIHTLEVGEAHA